MAENNCFHAWHNQCQEKALGTMRHKYVPSVDRDWAAERGAARVSTGSESSTSGTESEEGGVEQQRRATAKSRIMAAQRAAALTRTIATARRSEVQ